MKIILFFIIGALIVWLLIMVYEIEIAIGVHCGLSKDLMVSFFWVTLSVTILNEIFKEIKE